MPKKNYSLRYSAGQPAKRIFSDSSEGLSYSLKTKENLADSDRVRVVVWNIYKQNRANWLYILKSYARDANLVLLQEAQATPELIHFATENYLSVDQVPALVLPYRSSGVMTLACTYPIYCCPLKEKEPILRLSKSALVTVYPLIDDVNVMVVNIHAVNFSLGVNVYSRQLGPIGHLVQTHEGPVIMAGDFNAWSRQRINALYRFAHQIGLHEVRFSVDHRKKVFGRPLDFIFYRGLETRYSSVLVTNASDHNPLIVEFEVMRR